MYFTRPAHDILRMRTLFARNQEFNTANEAVWFFGESLVHGGSITFNQYNTFIYTHQFNQLTIATKNNNTCIIILLYQSLVTFELINNNNKYCYDKQFYSYIDLLYL